MIKRKGKGFSPKKKPVCGMNVKICVGSSCHIKGAPGVIAAFKEAVAALPPEKQEQVMLTGCFCQGECQRGVNVSIDGKEYHEVKPEQVADMLQEGW